MLALVIERLWGLQAIWALDQGQIVKCIAADRKEPTGQSILAIRQDAEIS